MYLAQKPEEWAHIIKDSGSKLLFATDHTIVDRLQPHVADLPELKQAVVFQDQVNCATVLLLQPRRRALSPGYTAARFLHAVELLQRSC